jgi:hypothetical protein
MIGEIMQAIKNYFPTETSVEGEFTISDGFLALPFIDGQYFRIEGSTLNDDVYIYPCDTLRDETFHGVVTLLSPPAPFIRLAARIADYQSANGVSPYTSESFGGYSYAKATNASGAPISWQEAFRSELNKWRKI